MIFNSPRRRASSAAIAVAAFTASLALVVAAAAPAYAASVSVYDSMPSPYPPNIVSQAFQATQTSEFGDEVTLGGTNRNLDNVVISFSSWACEVGEWNLGNCVTTPSATFNQMITMNIYNTNTVDATLPGTLLATVTNNVVVPFRPSADPNKCTADTPGGPVTRWFDTTSGKCSNGLAFNWAFDFASLNKVLPNTVIVTIAFNTSGYGSAPTGTIGPADALNVSLAPAATSIGSQVADEVFWNTKTASNYADGGLKGTGTLRMDTSQSWTPNGGLVMTINASAPAPVIKPSLAATGIDSTAMVAGTWIGGGVLAAGAILFGIAGYSRRRQVRR